MTRPDLFESYLIEQLRLIMRNHGVPVMVSESETPIPVHFAFLEGTHVDGSVADRIQRPIRDLFDVPDLDGTDDQIANGTFGRSPASRGRWRHSRRSASTIRCTGCRTTRRPARPFPEFRAVHQLPVLHRRVLRLCARADGEGRRRLRRFVEPGNVVTPAGEDAADRGATPARMPQMPAYHLKKPGHGGITMVNIGVGPSNAKTITDHIAVLRPHAWLMLGHCAGLRNTQALGDYVLAHAYVREDHVLDDDLPVWVPIPPLAEVQVALQEAVAEVTGLSGYDLKRIMRTERSRRSTTATGNCATSAGRCSGCRRSRAIALDMESATIAANGFRFRVPYGTLLCVSDKPLHGELKLPGMASEFYKRQVAQHLTIGIRAMEKLAEMPPERLHSRKLRSFAETAFQ